MLFVILVLFIVALVFIIIQLGKMTRHIRVLDETTLEIRRYEEAEEVTLRMLETEPQSLSLIERRRAQTIHAAALKAEAKVFKQLLDGKEPVVLKHTLVANGALDHFATRVVNNASYWLDRGSVLEKSKAKYAAESLKK